MELKTNIYNNLGPKDDYFLLVAIFSNPPLQNLTFQCMKLRKAKKKM